MNTTMVYTVQCLYSMTLNLTGILIFFFFANFIRNDYGSQSDIFLRPNNALD